MLPRPSAKLCCLSLEHKAVFIALPIGKYDILKLFHHALSAEVHEGQSSCVVWFTEAMCVCKSVQLKQNKCTFYKFNSQVQPNNPGEKKDLLMKC